MSAAAKGGWGRNRYASQPKRAGGGMLARIARSELSLQPLASSLSLAESASAAVRGAWFPTLAAKGAARMGHPAFGRVQRRLETAVTGCTAAGEPEPCGRLYSYRRGNSPEGHLFSAGSAGTDGGRGPGRAPLPRPAAGTNRCGRRTALGRRILSAEAGAPRADGHGVDGFHGKQAGADGGGDPGRAARGAGARP